MGWAVLRPRLQAVGRRIPCGRLAPVRVDDDPVPRGAAGERRDDYQDEFPALTFVPVVVEEPVAPDPPLSL
jgi:hypothetical protein